MSELPRAWHGGKPLQRKERPVDLPVERPLELPADRGPLASLSRRVLLGRLRSLRHGRLVIRDGAERFEAGAPAADAAAGGAEELQATVTVRDRSLYADVLFGGTLGAAEAYMDGKWTCDDLTALIRILVRNRELMEAMESGLARLGAPLRKLIHVLRRNTRSGSRRNIAAHYDLGNEFFSLFLDETMTYSCALFERESDAGRGGPSRDGSTAEAAHRPDETIALREASLAKIEQVCRKLELSPRDRLLEIGTGWGSFAIHAASRYGCHVTTTTISKEQFEFARARVRAAGLQGRVTLLLEDYRSLRGRYDKLASIEMIEAVGHAYFDSFFRTCSRLLEPAGMMLLQAITIADQRYEQSRRSVDFISRYIFPGGCLPSVAVICGAVARVTDMRLVHMEDITAHYAATLAVWRRKFVSNLDRIRALGFPESFLRMWEYYLCYCEGAFRERATGDVQMLFVKPEYQQAAVRPGL